MLAAAIISFNIGLLLFRWCCTFRIICAYLFIITVRISRCVILFSFVWRLTFFSRPLLLVIFDELFCFSLLQLHLPLHEKAPVIGHVVILEDFIYLAWL